MQHNENGLHYAINSLEQTEMEKNGWFAIAIHPAEAKRLKSEQSLTKNVILAPSDEVTSQEPNRKPGRPPKLSVLGGNNGNSPAGNKQKS